MTDIAPVSGLAQNSSSKQVTSATNQKFFFTYLEWAQHMIFFGLMAFLLGVFAFTAEYIQIKLSLIGAGSLLTLIGSRRFLMYWLEQHYPCNSN